MLTLNATEARKTFFELIKQSNQTHEIYEIQHKSGNAVMMSAQEYESLQETLLLLSDPDFNRAFSESVKEADSGQTNRFEEVFGEAL
ncbi:type II toxin-antitoxin system Phd/YefM family antitoxin [Hydrogenovibrio halophilus]|uniref:type II toxin-antitoxin system Phd/YefM family antitoxin n=1 Tax=Hydrogenovibrio halophilus TaxID=373391 RepID=UPI00036603A8|nr:type II toxin-antitoxin system Phd/YefM family antitoxin [Hydrogenovibrio halophilus]